MFHRQTAGTTAPSERIVSSPEICGGEPRIAGTRVPVRVLAAYRQQGSSDTDLLHDFPFLRQEDLTAAWLYIGNHPDLTAE